MSKASGRFRFPASNTDFLDLEAAITTYVLPGFLPEAPLVGQKDVVFTLGSCFARNLAESLAELGQPVAHTNMEEWVNSPLANKTMLEYAIERKPFATEDHAVNFPQQNLETVLPMVKRAKLLVFTVGVAFCPFENGQLVIKIDPVGWKSGRITQRLTTAEENANWLADITRLLRQANPDLHIVFSLSPVPLARSMLHSSIFVADCLSKSTLRIALDQFLAMGFPRTYYWPAFEVVRWMSGHAGAMYGDDGNPRHVSKDTVRTIVALFCKHFVAG